MRRLAMVAGITTMLLLAGAAVDAGAAFASRENVLVLSRANNGSEGRTAAAVLRSLGYTVTLTSTLPAKLAPYSSVWSIIAYAGFSFAEEEALENYVKTGGRLYLTGERPCCEALDLSDQEIARAVLKNQEIVVGQQGDIPGEPMFNPEAEDHITSEPNTITQFLSEAPGGIAGIGGINARNVLASNGTTAVGGVFDEHDMLDGKGRLVLYMDIDWLAGYSGGGGGMPEARHVRSTGARPQEAIGGEGGEEAGATTRNEVIENIEDFLEKTPTRVPPTSAEYVGLGDSYASGVGSFSYLPGTTGKNGCYRATHGYIEDIATEFDLSLGFAACSGATISNLWEGKGAQLKELGPNTRFVTLSIGGNDVGFASVLESCVSGFLAPGKKGCATRDAPAAKLALEWLREGREPGKYKLPGGFKSDKNKQRLPSLQELYEAILQQAPDAEVVVVGYPKLFETGQSQIKDCQVGTADGVSKLTIAAGDIEWLNQEADALDEVIEQAVDEAQAVTSRNIKFADPRGDFISHGLCDTEPSYINALLFEGLGAPPEHKPESFHPTTEGQEVLRALVEEVGLF